MEPAALDAILSEMDEACWRCGGTKLRPVQEPIIGAIVVCDECGHEHYFSTPIPNVPTNY